MENREQEASRHICPVLSQQIKGLGMVGFGLAAGFISVFVGASGWEELWGQRFAALARSRTWSSLEWGLGSLTDKPRIPPCTWAGNVRGDSKGKEMFPLHPQPLAGWDWALLPISGYHCFTVPQNPSGPFHLQHQT